MGGHQFIMDDGDIDGNSQLIRFRTAGGAQILLHDTDGLVYISNNKGTGWVEIGPTGNIDIYGKGDYSVRAEGNLNLRADKDINIDAGANLNILSGKNLTLETAKEFHLTSGKDMFQTSGKKLHFLSADDFVTTAKNVHFNGPAAAPAVPLSPGSKTNITNSQKESERPGSGSSSVNTIVTRFPTMEPYPEHIIGSAGGGNKIGRGMDIPDQTTVVKDPVTNKIIPPGASQGGAVVPNPVAGSPKVGMAVGSYVGVEYRRGQPVYEKIGTAPEMKLPTQWNLDEDGVDFIAGFEQYSPRVYNDVGGFETIGYGHRITPAERTSGTLMTPEGPIDFTQDLTVAQSKSVLQHDLAETERAVKQTVAIPLTRAQYVTMSSFTFSAGTVTAASSNLVAGLNQGNYGIVPTELQRWTKVGGKPIPGLINRRRAEAEYFSSLR